MRVGAAGRLFISAPFVLANSILAGARVHTLLSFLVQCVRLPGVYLLFPKAKPFLSVVALPRQYREGSDDVP